jgi:hypothetical protein
VAATTVAVVQENAAALLDHPDVAKALREVKLTPALAKAGATFEAAHPRFVRAVRKGKIPFQVFHAVWHGQGNNEIANFVARYEANELTTGQLVEKLEGGDVKASDLSACDIYAEIFYTGCMRGGGDAFECFILTEQFLCWCEGTRGEEGLCD